MSAVSMLCSCLKISNRISRGNSETVYFLPADKDDLPAWIYGVNMAFCMEMI